MVNMTKFNRTLTEYMEKKGISASKMAQMVGIKESTFYDMLKSDNPTLKNTLKVVDSLGSSLDYFERKSRTFKCDYKKDYVVNLPKTVKEYLALNNMSYLYLCKKTKISKANLTRWEQGGEPKYQTVVHLAKFFKVSIDKFIGRVD